MPEASGASEIRPPRPRHSAAAVVATWTRLLAITLIGLVQAPLLFGRVPPSQLGIWYLFFAVAAFISLSDLGLPATFARAVSFLRGREFSPADAPASNIPAIYQSITLSELYASAFVATLALGLALALVTFPAALVYFARTAPHVRVTLPLVAFLSGVVLSLTATIPGACLSGSGEVALDNVVRTGASAFGFALICAWIPLHPSLQSLCGIYLIQGLVGLVASHFALLRRCPVRLLAMRVNLRLVVSMSREAASIFVSRVGVWLTAESTMLIAGYFLGSERLADFGLLRQMAAVGSSIVAAIPVAIAPNVSAAHAAGDRETVRSLYLATLRYSLIANVLWTVGLLLWTPALIGLLVGPEHFLGTAILVPLAVASFLELHAMTHAFFVWNVGRWPFAPWIVGGGLLNLAFASAGCARWGFAGLAWGSMIAQAATVYWVQAAHAVRAMGLTLGAYLRNTVSRTAAYAAAVASAGLLLRALASPFLSFAGASGRIAGGAAALLAIAATAGVAGAVAWRVVLTPADRAYFAQLLRLGAPRA